MVDVGPLLNVLNDAVDPTRKTLKSVQEMYWDEESENITFKVNKFTTNTITIILNLLTQYVYSESKNGKRIQLGHLWKLDEFNVLGFKKLIQCEKQPAKRAEIYRKQKHNNSNLFKPNEKECIYKNEYELIELSTLPIYESNAFIQTLKKKLNCPMYGSLEVEVECNDILIFDGLNTKDIKCANRSEFNNFCKIKNAINPNLQKSIETRKMLSENDYELAEELTNLLNEYLSQICHERFVLKYCKDYKIKQSIINTNIQINQNRENLCSYQILKVLFKSDSSYFDDFGVGFDGNLYNYKKSNGLWEKCETHTMDDLLDILEDSKKINNTDINTLYRNSNSLIFDILKVIRCKKTNIEFDKYTHLFCMKNGVYDLNENVFRLGKREEYCSLTTYWEYNETDADFYMPELIQFFTKLFPQKDEYDLFMSFIYLSLVGNKSNKLSAILTDHRDGDNGKSTIIDFLKQFLDAAYEIDGKQFLYDSNNDSGINGHKSNELNLKGKKLMLVDETRQSRKLNDEFLTNIASKNLHIQGRQINSSQYHRFVAKANLLIACNRNKMLSFDITDKNLTKRLLVFRMRSKFLKSKTFIDDYENMQFKVDVSIDDKFELWRSSFLKLVSQYKNVAFDLLCEENWPDSIKSNLQTLIAERSGFDEDTHFDFNDWFKENMIYEEDLTKCSNLNDIKKKVCEKFSINKNKYTEIIKIWVRQINRNYEKIEIIEKLVLKQDEKRFEKRNVIKNYRLIV